MKTILNRQPPTIHRLIAQKRELNACKSILGKRGENICSGGLNFYAALPHIQWLCESLRIKYGRGESSEGRKKFANIKNCINSLVSKKHTRFCRKVVSRKVSCTGSGGSCLLGCFCYCRQSGIKSRKIISSWRMEHC